MKGNGKTPESKLDALRKRLSKLDLGSGGTGFWSPKVGKNTIRILPEVGSMDYFFQPVGRHQLGDNNKNDVYCPSFVSDGELPCPICEIIDQLYKAGDDASKEMAKKIKLRKSFWMNIVVRGQEDDGPKVYTPGVQVFETLISMINDPDYGEVYDVESGVDIIIEREGTGLDTEYQVLAKRKSSPLSDDESLVEEWLEKARDLSWVEVSEDPDEDAELSKGHGVYVLPYQRLVEEYALEIGLGDYEEPAPKKSSKPAATKAASKRQPEPEEEDDDEEEYGEEEDEDEDDNPKKAVAKRMARRSARH